MPAQIRLCDHLKANGVFCGSPALRGHLYCHFHHQWRETKPNQPAGEGAQLDLPLLEDANAVQLALQQVIRAIATDQISHKKAGLLLYALQTASCNLKRTNFEHYKLQEQAEVEYREVQEPEDEEESCEVCAPDEDEDEEQPENGAAEAAESEPSDAKATGDSQEPLRNPVTIHACRADRAGPRNRRPASRSTLCSRWVQ